MACSIPTLTILSNGISNCLAVGGWKHQDILREPLIKSPYYEIIGKRKPWAYASEGGRQAALARGIDWRVSRKASRGKRLNCADRSF